ncbi:hypothetical protein V6N13_038130 [Hibiscus sabdariffa]|uniref:Uncharacterized protein n=1 Tax=Hibiscus sabdariffa TaxID=183260 RepID=A0ABR2S3S1_9ROSI
MNTVLLNLRTVAILWGVAVIFVLVILVLVYFCLIIPINWAIERSRRRQASYPVVGVMQSRTNNGDLENQLSSDQAVDHIVQQEPSQNQHDKTSRSTVNGGEIESCCTADCVICSEKFKDGDFCRVNNRVVTDLEAASADEDKSSGEVMYIADESTGEVRPIRFFTPPRFPPPRNLQRVATVEDESSGEVIYIKDKSTGELRPIRFFTPPRFPPRFIPTQGDRKPQRVAATIRIA